MALEHMRGHLAALVPWLTCLAFPAHAAPGGDAGSLPEPGTVALLGLALAIMPLILWHRRRRKRR